MQNKRTLIWEYVGANPTDFSPSPITKTATINVTFTCQKKLYSTSSKAPIYKPGLAFNQSDFMLPIGEAITFTFDKMAFQPASA